MKMDTPKLINVPLYRRTHNVRDFLKSFSDTVKWVQSDSGIGKLDDGVCGSTAGDYPSSESYFYFKMFETFKQ